MNIVTAHQRKQCISQIIGGWNDCMVRHLTVIYTVILKKKDFSQLNVQY